MGQRRPDLDLLILGDLAVRAGGRDVALPGPSVRALLGALLLTSNESVGEDRLLELGWGADRGSRRALQCAAHRLRGWLGGLADKGGPLHRLEHSGNGYRLEIPDDAVDVARFRQLFRTSTTAEPERRLALLSAALGEWRGPVFGGRPEWLAADPAVRAIEQARVDCASALADLAIRLGRPSEVVATVSEVAANAPYDEPLQARLVRLMSLCGRHAEAVRQVDRVRRRLAADLGIAPSPEIRSAHAAAVQGGGRFAAVPAELPPDLPDLTGRQAEIDAVAGILAADRGPAVCAVNGAAGAGKTVLAVHAAHRVGPLYAGGHLYAELRGARPYDVLGRFLRALGTDAQAVPAAFEERVALYRSRTAGRRVLVVLDDATDEAQVRPLVPGSAGSAVLVTGRACLAGLAGARLLTLGPLDPRDAVRLLDRVAGRPGLAGTAEAHEIVRLCDLSPLAVRIAGVRLATRPRMSPGLLAALLRREDRRLDELSVHGLTVRASLESARRDLVPAHRRAFRRLGEFRTCEFTAPPTGDLEALVDVGLLQVIGEDLDTGGVRYRLSDLVRLYARELPDGREPVLRAN
ncbi:BTAD domain-containing putative transcriptional regulator [Spirillospora sp. NPDC047279]|uniref:AfsR/SARP family transcriptional regulator n=1 Tax=Spirillospora sp. NPDC047279 TaxID=3155478 RepID=UPI0033E820E0